MNVDGYRCGLPIPRRNRDDGGWSVTQFQHDFFRVLDQLERLSEFSEFDRYFADAGFEIREEA